MNDASAMARPRSSLVALAVLAACSPPPPPAPPPASSGAEESAQDVAPSAAGFVLYTRHETWIVPLDPEQPIEGALGLWVLDDDPSHGSPSVRVIVPELPEALLPTCACGETEQACPGLGGQAQTVGDGGPLCGCVLRELPEVNTSDPEDEALFEEEAWERECEGDGSTTLAALTGGVLFGQSWVHECGGGLNQYEAYTQVTPLVHDEAGGAIDPEGMRVGCDPIGAELDWTEPGDPAELPCELTEAGEWRPREPGAPVETCADCEHVGAEMRVERVRSGFYERIDDRVYVSGGGPRVVSRIEARADTCPSSADPCGDPALFPDLDASAEHWVATDGTAALALSGEQVTVLVPRATLRAETLPRAVEGVLGARFHRDLAPLRALVRARAPRALAGDGCRSDDECLASAACDSFCREGRCARRSRGECDEAHGCEHGASCDGGRCRLVPVLADADRALRDRRRGRDWGARCVEHLRADRLAQAHAACDAGLAIATEPGVRGALLYNLGLVAQRIGDLDSARAHFRESLRVRPDNEPVERALESLDRQ